MAAIFANSCCNAATPVIVYKITNITNGKLYIGITTRSVKRRWALHCSCARHGSDLLLSRAIRKYGTYGFLIDVICECASAEELKVCERGLIAAYGTLAPNGYNLTSGGDGRLGFRLSDETKNKISDAQHKAYADGRGYRGGFKGPHTFESRAKMAEIRKIWKPSEEMIAGARQRFSDDNPMRDPDVARRSVQSRSGRKNTPESIEKMSEGRAEKLTKDIVADIKRRVLSGEKRIILARKYGISRSMVGAIVTGRTWKHVGLQESVS